MKRASVFVLALIILLGAFFHAPMQVRASSEPTVMVYITFEGYNLGHDFYVVLRAANVPVGTTVMDLTIDTLETWGYDFTLTPWGGLDRIYDIHPGWPAEPPPYITVEVGEGANDGSLGSFDYTEYSGWMFTVNHVMPDVGADDFVLSDGDVIRWQFSIEGWGADLGLGVEQGFWTDPLFEQADKSELIRLIFYPGMDSTSQEILMSIIIDPFTPEELVNDALLYFNVWDNPFTDVAMFDWFYEAVRFMYLNQWMIGVGNDRFAPHMEMTRAMAVTLLWRLEGFLLIDNPHPFKDVPQNAWFTDAAAWAAAFGVVDAGEYFNPHEVITDLQFYRMLGFDVFWEDAAALTRADAADIIYGFFLW